MREEWSTPEHRTRILPLRILANHVFHPISYWFFMIGIRANDKIEWDYQYKWWNKIVETVSFRIYKVLNYPYEWWGTLYKIDMDKIRESLEGIDMSGEAWNDYDADGVPYWEKTGFVDPDYDLIWDYVDEETGDAFRLV